MIAEQTERSWLEEPAARRRGGGREAGGGKNTYVECTESGEQECRDAEGQSSSHIGPGRTQRPHAQAGQDESPGHGPRWCAGDKRKKM